MLEQKIPRNELHYMWRLDGVRLLLQHDVDIHAQNGEGRTPFHVASVSESSGPNPEYGAVITGAWSRGSRDAIAADSGPRALCRAGDIISVFITFICCTWPRYVKIT
jgi:hypothetical protein